MMSMLKKKMLDEEAFLQTKKRKKKSIEKEKESKVLNIRKRMNSVLESWGKALL